MRTNAKRLVSRTLRVAAIHARLLEALAVCILLAVGAIVIANAAAGDRISRKPANELTLDDDGSEKKEQIRKLLLPVSLGGNGKSWGEVLEEWQGGYPDDDPDGTSPHPNLDAHADAMAAFYNHKPYEQDDATLLPTVKKGVWNHSGGLGGGGFIKDYFGNVGNFLKKKPKLTAVEHDRVFVIDNYALHDGLYSFELDTADGRRHTRRARFTLVWKKTDNLGDPDYDPKWTPQNTKIVHHHSSAEPETDCWADLNGDGVVDWDDVLILLQKWGQCPL